MNDELEEFFKVRSEAVMVPELETDSGRSSEFNEQTIRNEN